MLLVDGSLSLVLFALWVFCLIDVITTDELLCRHLQKAWWVLIVLLLFDLGAVLWLVAGRPWQERSRSRPQPRVGGDRYPEYDRPGRFAATTDEDDEEFLRRCRERAEEQRRRYKEQLKDDTDPE
ncbi:MAG: PLD nuclease N-terminal domain-containing protein [Nocardioidaceae bacterium]